MSEIQSLTSFELIKYIVGGYSVLVAFINALMIYIFRNVKKDIEEIKRLQKKDHDRLNTVCTEHNVYHNKGGNGHNHGSDLHF